MSKKAKQISFLTAIVILVSGTIGSGIFFKNASLFKIGQGNIGFVLGVWLIAATGILAFGIGIAEMASRAKGKQGVLSWTKTFLPKRIHASSKNFLQIIFIPIILFALPLYAVKGIQTALSEINIFLTGWEAGAIAFAFFIWFAIMTYISLIASVSFQWMTMAIKFIPLLVLPILSFVVKSESPTHYYSSVVSDKSSGVAGWGNGSILLIAGIPAIFFSFDGFYTVTTLKDNMKDKNKMSSVISVGLVIITIVYIWVSLSFMNGSKTGKYSDISALDSKWKQVFSWLIAIGILGVVNGYVQFATNTYIKLDEENDSWLTKFFNEKIFRNKLSRKTGSFMAMMIIVTIVFWMLVVVGIYGWKTSKGSNDYQNLLGFDGVITNFKSLLMFSLIALTLAFALPHFKKETIKQKIVFGLSIISITFVAVILLFQIISSGIEISGFNGSDIKSSIIKLSLLLGIPLLSVIMGMIEVKITDKKYAKKVA